MAMMSEAHAKWTTSSTGGGKAQPLSRAMTHLSVYFTTSSGCTATVALQTCAGSTLGPWVTLSASTAMSSGACLLQQFSGPLDYVRPYVSAIKASTDVVTTELLGA